jgi:hypothetical protein
MILKLIEKYFAAWEQQRKRFVKEDSFLSKMPKQ